MIKLVSEDNLSAADARTENSMDTDNIGEESRSKDHEDRDSHIEH